MVYNMKYLSENIITNKRVIVRCDFNVPVKNGIVEDNLKIINSLKTLNYLLNNNNKVIILSHFGRVKEESDKENNSLKSVFEELKKHIDVEFIEDPLKLENINSSTKKCFLVENTRYTDLPSKRESNNDLELAKYWSQFADVFVLDAFGSSHRAHSSTAGISKYLPTFLGFLVQEELTNLDFLIENKEQRFAVIMGGAKVDDKIKIIESLINKCDVLFLTGGILNTFLKVAGENIGKSLSSNDEEVVSLVKKILENNKDKIYFTNQFVVNRDGIIHSVKLNEIKEEDIIYDNIPNISKVISQDDIVFLNGTCGKYEDDDYSFGTLKLFEALKKSGSKVIIGGGDTASAVNKLSSEKNFYYVSTGGGASLEYIAYENLKALEWIKNNGVEN